VLQEKRKFILVEQKNIKENRELSHHFEVQDLYLLYAPFQIRMEHSKISSKTLVTESTCKNSIKGINLLE
jgi:hypothetical protein